MHGHSHNISIDLISLICKCLTQYIYFHLLFQMLDYIILLLKIVILAFPDLA